MPSPRVRPRTDYVDHHRFTVVARKKVRQEQHQNMRQRFHSAQEKLADVFIQAPKTIIENRIVEDEKLLERLAIENEVKQLKRNTKRRSMFCKTKSFSEYVLHLKPSVRIDWSLFTNPISFTTKTAKKTGLIVLAVLIISTVIVGFQSNTSEFRSAVDMPRIFDEDMTVSGPPNDVASLYDSRIRVSEPSIKDVIPKQLRLPRLNIDAEIVALGLLQNGVLSIPKDIDKIGWYKSSSVPGVIGTTVLNGHYGSDQAPLQLLSASDIGDIIEITVHNNVTYSYEIIAKNFYTKEDVPMHTLIAEDKKEALSIITNFGTWDASSQLYSHRLIVQAKRIR